MSVKKFYNKFKEHFLKDYIYGNNRLFAQREFLAKCLPVRVSKVLIIGSGIGDLVPFLLNYRKGLKRIVCVDISDESIEIGRRLFVDDRVEYVNVDVTQEEIQEKDFDVIIFPDSYEHMPLDLRETVAKEMGRLLTDRGAVYFTVPSIHHQKRLRKLGEGLQIVDEDVTIDDLQEFGTLVEGELTYINFVSAWRRHDYMHAVVERKPDEIEELDSFCSAPREDAGVRRLLPLEKVMRLLRYNKVSVRLRKIKLNQVLK